MTRPTTFRARRRRAQGLGDPVRWTRVDPDTPGYPWEVGALHPHNFPTPGMFVDLDEPGLFQVESGFDGLVRAALGSAMVMANVDPEVASSRTSQGRQLRQQFRGLLFSRWHMALYGCSNENYCGGVHPDKPGAQGKRAIVSHVMSARGSGINLLPRHGPNKHLLAHGRAPRRTTDLAGEPLLGAPGTCRPLLWVPAVDLARLASSSPDVVALRWRDGTSTVEPPPVVRRFGAIDPIALPGMPSLIDEGEA